MPIPSGPPAKKVAPPITVSPRVVASGSKLKKAEHRIAPALLSLVTPVDSLTPDPINARLHPEDNMQSIKASLTQYGQVKPIVVRKSTNVVVAGNGTLAAAKSLGWNDIATVFVDFTDAEAAGYGVADNRTAELAKWDYEVLKRLDAMMKESEHAVIGWSDKELETIRGADFTAPVEPESNGRAKQSQPSSSVVKVYVAGPYTIGDVEENVSNAIAAANELADLGFAPFVPHLNHYWHMMYPRDYEFWTHLDMQWLQHCDIVLRLLGESNGADEEVKYATEHGIPVFYSIEELAQHYQLNT